MHCSPSRLAVQSVNRAWCGLAPAQGAACVSGYSVLDQRYERTGWSMRLSKILEHLTLRGSF